MDGIDFDQILALIEKILRAFKDVMAWLGILVLPEEDGSDGYTYPGEDNSPVQN